MYDTVIIGAGMSGLAAGIRLAHFERRVCILERHSVVGGLNSFYGRRGRIYDAALHAVTNYAPKGVQGPLARLLRQLRLAWEEFSLVPQIGSAIVFPGVRLEFTNDFALLEAEIAREFPKQKDNFRRLVGALEEYDQFGQGTTAPSARAVVGSYLTDPLLVEMLFCPMLSYGGAREHDMSFAQFSMLFRSIFLEGLARPLAGIRMILTQLLGRFRKLGGELRLRSAVSRILACNGKAAGVVLADGTELPARNVLSSAGWPETISLCGDAPARRPRGGLSVIESISFLSAQPRDLGCNRTVLFYNDSEKFHYRRPQEAVDLRSGVVTSPNNFAYPDPLPEGIIRLSALANYDCWAGMDAPTYRQQKLYWHERLAAAAVQFVPDFRAAVVETDVSTPLTFERFTGHHGGAIYGAEEKRYDGTTHLENLFVCGNDQGLVGVVGAILSGINVVNRYLLKS
jgi:phytoene dehydrogenase-like protein